MIDFPFTKSTAMLTEWESVLRRAGAVIENAVVAQFHDPAQERRAAAGNNVIADLSHLGLIRASGADAVSFLQGQFSNDIKQLNDTTQLHAYCTAQGRMLALLRAFARAGDIYLQLPAALVEPTLKRLRMFVLRAQVKLESADDTLARIGVSGPSIEQVLARIGIEAPRAPNGCGTAGEISVMRVPGLHPRFILVAPPVVLAPLWEKLADVTPVGAGVWSWLDIVAGVPQIYPATVEAFVPQMTNLDVLGGINFKKGCYPGQEIVARMHYLGRLKQRMYRAHIDAANPPPAAGAPLFAPDFGTQAAGTVVDAQPGPDGGYDLLAVIHISSANGGDVRLAKPDGVPLRLLDLPYTVETAQAKP